MNDSDPNAVLILGPGSALFTIGLSNPPGITVDQLEQDFINGGFFRRAVPRYFHSFQLTIAGISGRRMTYSFQSGGGCITNLNQVFLVTQPALVLLTGTTCIGEEALFPSEWIERMQASFTPISLAPTPNPTALPMAAPAQRAHIGSPAGDQFYEGADVMRVSVSGNPGSYSFSVTVRSPDAGCDQYADWWEVVSPEGQLIFRRVLLHSHVGEQPFTRSGGPFGVQQDEIVIIRGHMNTTGYGGIALRGNVAEGFAIAEIPPGFATGVDIQEPLPTACAF